MPRGDPPGWNLPPELPLATPGRCPRCGSSRTEYEWILVPYSKGSADGYLPGNATCRDCWDRFKEATNAAR